MADCYSALEEGLKVGLYEAVDDLQSTGLLDGIDLHQLAERAGQAVHAALASFVWEERLGPALETGQVCHELGVSRQAVAKAVVAGRLVVLPAGKTRRFPVWQFRMQPGRFEMRAEVAEVIETFRRVYPEVTAVQIAAWARTTQPELDGTTPAEWLERERPAHRVVLAAERAASALAQ